MEYKNMTVGELIEMQNFFHELSDQSDDEIIKGLRENRDAMLELARAQKECYQELAGMSLNDFEKYVHWAKAYVWAQKKCGQRHPD
jgi:hypothetical protein